MSAQPFWKALRLGTLLIAFGFILGCGRREPTQEEVLADALSLSTSGDHSAAISLLEEFLQTHPGAFPVIDALAFNYAESGDEAMAAFYFNRAAEVDPSQPEYLLYAAEALEAIDDVAGVVDNYHRYLQARPRDRAILIKLGELQARRGDRSAALDAFLQANRIESDGALQVELGRLYLESGNRAVAQTWFASAAQADSESRGQALLGLLEVALRADRFGDAETLVETLDREYPDLLDHSRLARTRDQLATWRRTREEAEAAVAALRDRPERPEPAATEAADGTASEEPEEQEPTGPEAVAALTDETLESGPLPLFPDPSPARETAPPPPPNPTGYDGLLRLARHQAAEGAHTEAIRNFQRALARDDADPAVWRDLSASQFEAGQQARAPASASEAVRRAPNDPTYLLHYLRVSAATLPPERVLRALEAARNQFPDSPGIALALGRAYDEQGSRRYAGRMYTEFLRLAAPDHPARAEIEALLNN